METKTDKYCYMGGYGDHNLGINIIHTAQIVGQPNKDRTSLPFQPNAWNIYVQIPSSSQMEDAHNM